MKRKFVCGIVALCLALSVAGCGKSSEERQAVNYYQNELGLDKEDAEELAHAIYGEDEEESGVTEEETSVTEEVPEETVVEPLPELVNSEWYERKVQIYDMVFDNDWHLTEEDIRKIVEGSAYDVVLIEGFDANGEVCPRTLEVNGELVAYLVKLNWSSSSDDNLEKYGFMDEECWYEISYIAGNCYDKESVEFKDFQTRDDVLAYLAANGFVEVEKEQATYAGRHGFVNASVNIYPDETSVEYADVPHYYCNGAQSITFFRIRKLGETDQEFEYGYYTRHYSGAHLNVVNSVTFEFDIDGTIVSKPGLPGPFNEQPWNIGMFTILGDRID